MQPQPDDDAPGGLTPDDLATKHDVNSMAEAVVEHSDEGDRRLAARVDDHAATLGVHVARVDDLEATVVALRQLIQQRLPVQDGSPPSSLPSARPLDQWPVNGE